MQVFHGSWISINTIDLRQCKANRDFGKGFYVTKYREQADTGLFLIEDITDNIIEQLMYKLQINETAAAEIFYSSSTFALLADKSNKYYENSWETIYRQLLEEINKTN